MDHCVTGVLRSCVPCLFCSRKHSWASRQKVRTLKKCKDLKGVGLGERAGYRVKKKKVGSLAVVASKALMAGPCLEGAQVSSSKSVK